MRLRERDAYPEEQKILDRRPDYDDAIAMCVECWHELGSSRVVHPGGIGSIPFDAILRWAEFTRLDHELTMLLKAVIQRLDRDRSAREAGARRLKGAS